MGQYHPEGGIEVLQAAKKKDPFVMVLLFTAQEKLIDREEIYRDGAFDCIEKNILGRAAWQEIEAKAKAAIHFRELLLSNLKEQGRESALRRFFDPSLYPAIREQPKFLDLKMRPVTALFADVRGFTRIVGLLESRPQLVEGFLLDFYQAARTAVFTHNGILDKLMGDGVMALFCGVGRGEGDFATRGAIDAVAAALELRQRFEGIRGQWQAQWQAHLGEAAAVALGVGLHTGQSLVGNLGLEDHEQFTAIGANVNFAARLEKRAPPGQILISEATAKRLPESYATTSLGVARGTKNIPDQMVLQLDGKR
jgi:adenylate cyclase